MGKQNVETNEETVAVFLKCSQCRHSSRRKSTYVLKRKKLAPPAYWNKQNEESAQWSFILMRTKFVDTKTAQTLCSALCMLKQLNTLTFSNYSAWNF